MRYKIHSWEEFEELADGIYDGDMVEFIVDGHKLEMHVQSNEEITQPDSDRASLSA